MNSFTHEMVADANKNTIYTMLPDAVVDELPDVLQSATDKFWEVIGDLMGKHGISGDDLGWRGFNEWPPTVTAWVVDLLAGNYPHWWVLKQKVGDHVQIIKQVERFPHFICPVGWTGEVVDVTNGVVSVRMYRYLGPGADEWNNEIVFNGGLGDDDFNDYCKILGGATA